MTLEGWDKENHWLKKEPTSIKEIADLFGLVERNLQDASVESISLDAKIQFMFNAVLICATIPLRASGYRIPSTEGHHEKTINSLKFTLGSDATFIAKLNGFRKKRISITYDIAGATSPSEVANFKEVVNELYAQVRKWLKTEHPELLK